MATSLPSRRARCKNSSWSWPPPPLSTFISSPVSSSRSSTPRTSATGAGCDILSSTEALEGADGVGDGRLLPGRHVDPADVPPAPPRRLALRERHGLPHGLAPRILLGQGPVEHRERLAVA